MLGAADDVILQRLVKQIELLAESGYAHGQVPVLVGMLLRVDERLRINVLNWTLHRPFWEAESRMSTNRSILLSVNSLGSTSTMAEVVPGAFLVGSFAIEFKSAVKPLKSLPCMGEMLYAMISPLRRPSGVAAVSRP